MNNHDSGFINRRRFLSGLGAAVIGAAPVATRSAWTQAGEVTSARETDQQALRSRQYLIEYPYLNVPISPGAPASLFQLSVHGNAVQEFPLQLAEDSSEIWIYIDVSEFKGQEITLSGPASEAAMKRIYQAGTPAGREELYRERNRPQFHFTVKRGWNNDVNGPIFYRGQYHLFWQAYPFGLTPDVGFMYWGHAVGTDLLHWTELAPALKLDRLGSPWSGTAFVDHHNAAGWGKDALILVFTEYDRKTRKQVQCLAYSTDNAETFTRYARNPVLDSNRELNTFDTRDPKVFWYEPKQHWVMVLFEKDGTSIYRSKDLKAWERRSHLPGLHECPDFFELPVDGDLGRRKWVLHGGSAKYFIGSFDGDAFTPESDALYYAEGKNRTGDDILYAAQSFAEMPGGRRVQMGWGRIQQDGMPFNQMMLFPTEFTLVSTPAGVRLRANPISEIASLHSENHAEYLLINQEPLRALASGLHVKATLNLAKSGPVTIQYAGRDLATIEPADAGQTHASLEILIDKSLAEIFVDRGARYLLRELAPVAGAPGLGFMARRKEVVFEPCEAFEMKSIWA